MKLIELGPVIVRVTAPLDASNFGPHSSGTLLSRLPSVSAKVALKLNHFNLSASFKTDREYPFPTALQRKSHCAHLLTIIIEIQGVYAVLPSNSRDIDRVRGEAGVIWRVLRL